MSKHVIRLKKKKKNSLGRIFREARNKTVFRFFFFFSFMFELMSKKFLSKFTLTVSICFFFLLFILFL